MGWGEVVRRRGGSATSPADGQKREEENEQAVTFFSAASQKIAVPACPFAENMFKTETAVAAARAKQVCVAHHGNGPQTSALHHLALYCRVTSARHDLSQTRQIKGDACLSIK